MYYKQYAAENDSGIQGTNFKIWLLHELVVFARIHSKHFKQAQPVIQI